MPDSPFKHMILLLKHNTHLDRYDGATSYSKGHFVPWPPLSLFVEFEQI
jgi:hypothetical protein